MGGKSSSDTQTSQTQDSSVNPWQNSLPAINNLLTGINGRSIDVGANPLQSQALSTLSTNALNTPNYGAQATGVAGNLLTGGPDLTGGANSALTNYQTASTGALNGYAGAQNAGNNSYQSSLSPYLSAGYLDPMKSPGIQGVLDTIKNDVGNSVNSQFAAAGRDMSGANQQAYGRGISQGFAAPLLNQYNQNVATQRGAQDASYGANNATSGNIYGAASGTAGNLYNAGNTTTGILSGLNQTSLGNQVQGLNLGMNAVPQAYNANANAQLAAQQQAYNLPLNNLGMLEGLTIPIAGLGQQSHGTGTGTSSTQNQMSGAQQFATIGQGFNSFMNPFRMPTGGGG